MTMSKLFTVLALATGLSVAHANDTGQRQAEIIDSTTVNASKQAQKSRQAAVRLVASNGHGSGTYVKIGKFVGVLTAAHVVADNNVLLVDTGSVQTVGIPIWKNQESDLAFLLLGEPLPGKKHVKISAVGTKIREGEEVIYSGFPSHHELLTFRCSVANAEKNQIVVQGFAWFGASGSGFINKKGDVFAVLSAVSVESFYGHPQVISTVVFAHTVTKKDISEIELILEALEGKL